MNQVRDERDEIIEDMNRKNGWVFASREAHNQYPLGSHHRREKKHYI